LIELEPETMTAAPRTRRQSDPPAAAAKTAPDPGADRRPSGAPVQIPDPPASPEELFNIAVAAINKRFKLGTLERLTIERPDLAAEIARAMDRVDITWRESGPVGSPAFKLALRTWYDLIILAIDYFEG